MVKQKPLENKKKYAIYILTTKSNNLAAKAVQKKLMTIREIKTFFVLCDMM